ncbi:MAG: hypothetical protein A2821_02260 [Candidatus Magasanikbacteria bacterium RIFCSPHIGHO2_01_FULL_41_23]|uniref:Uncharacterized protein n=1 Tax=Candidatus Magasanikbacteria bacterium RIFCSPLOWO2_01_FULL_40_15 TaxID=1798686 RepID=A0A1F6N2E1_9BACT|nr:MAG: hypothetical protein A2821_02260 [Candidatus Magasanikbacteria bacterium RIFCSPHIGHO2_01_FULL_41_23]OGH66840.1 MAG: hypothetical protein A3C66_02045 [Candidatus Magasanikbacteria bacterium RIFCSPHIGHO2_02_FULL_41_35]OGH74823.1 MAG: hypothetical protein A3F22_03970 [Candidatus Magasanikbacteria bacterium RIFCSPHIGHO2_12_FULL_41_16]OGH78099.1 MAG: hypothetical protein A2983_03395 [Candidatus Magasanikbacteria bacterium RIFCSPLOWO2_01_FULL_40_15]
MLGRLQLLAQKICPASGSSWRTPWMVFFGILFLGFFLLTISPANAQFETVTNIFIIGAAHIMIVVANIAIGLTIFFLRFFIMLASYNNYIDVDVVQLGWIMVRDVANMFFVVALLVIAFGTILGLEEYEWKKNLVKLILAAILINFSNLICQLLIDVSHVFSITFLNAISATAGGNLINMFKLDQITALAGADDTSGIDIELLAAAIPAMMFALMAAAALGSYVYVMAARVVALWALIIFSPLAFIFGVLPKTKGYAEKWWTEFNNNIIVVPIMVFFLWLSFATLGLGNIAEQIQTGLPAGVQIDGAQQGKTEYKKTSLSLSKVTSWENMASFLVAFAFLMRGIQETEQTGVTGAGAIGSAVDFAKKVGTIASGYAAGRWLAGKTRDGVVGGSKWVGKELGVHLAKRAGVYDVPERVGNWWKARGVAFDKRRSEGPLSGVVDSKEVGEGDQTKDETKKLTDEQVKAGWSMRFDREKNKTVAEQWGVLKDKDGNPKYKSGYQKFLSRRHEKIIASRKTLEKTEGEFKDNEELMGKRTEAQSFVTGAERRENRKLEKEGFVVKDYDRVKRGMLEIEEERASAKTAEFKNRGKMIALGSQRLKAEGGKPLGFQEGGTVAEQIAGHKTRAEFFESRVNQILKTAESKYKGSAAGKRFLEGKIQADLEIKAQEAKTKELQAGATTRIALTDTTDVLARTIEAEKAAHLEEQRLARVQKAEEREFYKGDHGQEELREEAVLKEQIAASEAGIKKEEAEAKREVAEGTGSGDEAKEREHLFKVAQDEKIAATKQAGVRESLATSVEKKAELVYETSDPGKEEKEKELTAKETIAATEGKIKKEEATRKAVLATEDSNEYKLQMAERIAAEKGAKLEEGKVALAEKEATKAYVSGTGADTITQTKEVELKTKAEDAEIKQREAEADRQAANNLKEVFARINFSEQATKAAEDFVKNIKEEDLRDKFKSASEQMKGWMKLDATALATEIEKFKTAGHTQGIDAYVVALGQAQLLKVTTSDSGIRHKQAEDAASDGFVNKSRYGTTTASTAYSDFSDTKLKDYKKLERTAAMKKATDVHAFLMHQKENLPAGQELDLDQTAELYAASSYLQSEAWNDDQAAYTYSMFEKLQRHQAEVANKGSSTVMKTDEAAQWTTMAKQYTRLGWLDNNVIDAGGNFVLDNEKKADGTDVIDKTNGKVVKKGKAIAKKYTRQKAADMQNLAVTGGDVNLVVAHHQISEAVDANARDVENAKLEARSRIIADKKSANTTLTDETAAASAEKEIESAMAAAGKATAKNYWELADVILKLGTNTTGIVDAAALKVRYEEHSDLLQDATKSYKGFAHATGHEKLGGNQGFDEEADSYRFMTVREGQAEVRADRVKMKTRQILNGDQYHSNGGELDLDTGIIDNFLEDTLNLTIGKITRYLDMVDMPERSLKGAFYLHKNEQAKVVQGTEGALKDKKVAVLGGNKAMQKFEADGDVDEESKTKHMMTRGVVPALMSGHRGWAVAASKLYGGHVVEADAQKGTINMRVGNKEFATTKNAAEHVITNLESDKDYFKGSDLYGQEKRILEAMNQIIADFNSAPAPASAVDTAAAGEDDTPPT